jgi:tRNA (guanine37-N1)-methyltransferase
VFRGWSVPDILLSGHHEAIRSWRLERARELGAMTGDARRARGA